VAQPATRPVRLAELAAALGRPLEGDGEVEIAGVAGLESAGPRELSFVRSEAFAEALGRTRAGAVILAPGLDRGGRSAIRSPQPGLDFARVAQRFAPPPDARPGIHPSAVVDPTARVDASASVGALCAVGARATVGARSRLCAGVVLYEDASVGADCVLHAHCVLREGTRLGDRVVLLSDTTVQDYEVDSSLIGVERPYRPVSIGGSVATTAEQLFTINAERLETLAPVLLGGGRNASSDVMMKWVRRTRVGGEWRDNVDASLGESNQEYAIDIYTTSGRTSVARTIGAITTGEATYTAAQQVSDFGSLQSVVYWRVFQLSSTVGRGHGADGTT